MYLIFWKSENLWSIDLSATARCWLVKVGNGRDHVVPTLETTSVALPVWREASEQERDSDGLGRGIYSPSPFGSFLGHSAKRWVEAVDVVVFLTCVTESHQVGILSLGTQGTHWKTAVEEHTVLRLTCTAHELFVGLP